jgi:hypothetical protein
MFNPLLFTVEENFLDYEGIPQLSVEEILGKSELANEDLNIELDIPLIGLTGHMTHTETAVIVGLIKAARISSFFEIGTFDGSTVVNLLRNCPLLKQIVTVDLPDDTHTTGGAGTHHLLDRINSSMLDTVSVGSRFKAHPDAAKVIQIRKDSAELRAADLDRPTYECFLIDGCHTFDYCRNDTEFAKLRALSGVTRYLLQMAGSGDYRLFWLRIRDTITSLVIGFRRDDFVLP